jgi:hypothetical protein
MTIHRHSPTWRWSIPITGFLALYVGLAYGLAPWLWKTYAVRHPAFDNVPGLTRTADDHPGDPINVALIGSETALDQAMRAAGWFEADALGLRSDVRIAEDTVLDRPFDRAPVSNLYLWGRKEDFAFEQPVGNNPRQRHHVRFWKSDRPDTAGRPLWVGSATYDERVGLSHTTGQITHHISADIDAERDHLFEDLMKAKVVADTGYVDGFHKELQGRNGGGDAWHTDGRLQFGTLLPD